ncbi:S-adenosyl-L-methionine-dependent methyltransferase [Lophium mytilinum]|uniref:S-adenosyl-L-methionine-dependent methyltransferase n=1 Tax=Lophium mytilinum TaxID=390894 RepID=A0A6A6QQ80_9PEZI|nr:S-adenosyl-L-methionine-dependent methyltransferase [Lophium mytilinum]
MPHSRRKCSHIHPKRYQSSRLNCKRGRTLATTITQYRYENGRRYHAFRDGEYYQPNDEKQYDYEMIVHHLWLLSLDDKLFSAPLNNPQKILDVGTGTGVWAVDIADIFPDAEIIGTDLSPTQTAMAPPNIRFEIDDCNSEWVYPEDSFDFVHMRSLSGCVSDWPALYRQCFKHIQPGGYLQHCEFSVRVINNEPGPQTARAEEMYKMYTDLVLQTGDMIGKSFSVDQNMPELIKEAGFVDIVDSKPIWPIGPWSSDERLKEVGKWNQRSWLDGLESWVLALFTRQLGWSAAQVRTWVEEMRHVIRDRNCHFYNEVYVPR